MPNLILPQSETAGPYNTDFWNGLASHLWEIKTHCHERRRPIEDRWEECDEAYFCYRYLPDLQTMDWVDDSEFGETDVHDAVNVISIRLALTLFPRHGGWINATSRKWEAQALVEAVQDQQIYLHEQAHLRRNAMRIMKQSIIRNVTAMFWEWRNKYRVKRLSTPETRRKIAEFLEASGMPKNEAKEIKRGLMRVPYFSGPVVRCVDVYDLFLDPDQDLLNDDEPMKILQTFRRLSELKKEEGWDNELLYQNLGGSAKKDLPEIVPYDTYDIWNNRDFAGGRVASSEIMGDDVKSQSTSYNKLVPVYIFHMPYLEWQDEEFWDCYFHVALSQNGPQARIIRVEENPNDAGHPQILLDTYVDWINAGHYGGIGGVATSLSKYRQLNVIENLSLQALTASVFPGMLLNVDAVATDQEIEFSPGSIVPIQGGIDPAMVMAPLPAPTTGTQLGEQGSRLWSEKLRAQMGVDALSVNNPSRSIASRRTATEINRDTTAGSMFLDNQAEQSTDMFNRYTQGVYDASRQHLRPDAYGEVTYEADVNGWVQEMRLQYEDLDVDRTIKIAGLAAIVNKDQRLERLGRGMEVSQGMLTAAPEIALPYVVKTYEQYMAELNITLTPEEKQEFMPQAQIGMMPGMGMGGGMPMGMEQQMMGGFDAATSPEVIG